jgi:4-amino-4-deoxy-L-arabinose transferase-like glycosyltransferase
MLPFIGKMAMWQTGFAAVPMSMLSFAFSIAGIWRLARRLMKPRWALVATAFYALNPNLLFLATTAMTEALFLALLVWTVVAAMECVAALRAAQAGTAKARMVLAGLLILGQVFTRYDGWIVGAMVWLVIALAWWRSPVRERTKTVFIVFTVMCVAGPLAWFWYNAHFEHDWLDFMRGPYSAAAIERKTAPPGQHYRGWHNPGWALLFYTRTAQIDAAAWETGFGLMAAALFGLWLQVRRRAETAVRGRGEIWATLLWVPLPFYVYSVTWGSVPIFIPQLWPHSYYNARYGMEMLPALAVYGALAGERLEAWMRAKNAGWARVGVRFWQPVAMMLCVANCLAMMYRIPLVLKEGIVNASTRVPFEKSLATTMQQWPLDAQVMMSTSAHVGAVQTAGKTLVSMVSENDEVAWEKALADPAHNAAYIIAMKGDPVEAAVEAHPEGLTELEVICTTGQPCAKVYQSSLYTAGPR